jgi:hypothetical protein
MKIMNEPMVKERNIQSRKWIFKNKINKLPLSQEVSGMLIWCGVKTIVLSHCHQPL